MIQSGKITDETKPRAGLTLTVRDMARILIVGDNDSDTERLKTAFREACRPVSDSPIVLRPAVSGDFRPQRMKGEAR